MESNTIRCNFEDKSMGDRDDLEYNLTFPSPGTFSGDPEPVVFLLGWAGSKDKYLAKYSSIYENEGCITIRYIHPFKSLFTTDPSDSQDHEMASFKLVQLLEDYDLLSNPVFVHVFSNGGFFIYGYLANRFVERKISMAGVVFDSSPAKLECSIAVRAILTANALPNRFLTYLAALAFSIFFFFVNIKYVLGFNRRPDLFEATKQSKTHIWPNLYLYSTADLLVPVKQIEEMASSRREIGVPFVQTHNFGTSSHVKHLKDFPDLYKAECVNFLHKCLSASRKK